MNTPDAALDYRQLVGRLDTGRTLGIDVTFSPEECWLLREHIRALETLPVPCTCFEAGRNPECRIHGAFAGLRTA